MNIDKKRLMWVMLIAMRCEFISVGPLGENPLTKKGRGWFPAWFWRAYNEAMCKISKQYRERMLYVLRMIKNDPEMAN